MDYSLCWLHLAPRAIPSITGRGQGSGNSMPRGLGVVTSVEAAQRRPCVPSDLWHGRAPLQAAPGSHRTRQPWARLCRGPRGPLLLWGLGSLRPPRPATSTRSVFASLGDPFGRVFPYTPGRECPGRPAHCGVSSFSKPCILLAEAAPELTGQPAHCEF